MAAEGGPEENMKFFIDKRACIRITWGWGCEYSITEKIEFELAIFSGIWKELACLWSFNSNISLSSQASANGRSQAQAPKIEGEWLHGGGA